LTSGSGWDIDLLKGAVSTVQVTGCGAKKEEGEKQFPSTALFCGRAWRTEGGEQIFLFPFLPLF